MYYTLNLIIMQIAPSNQEWECIKLPVTRLVYAPIGEEYAPFKYKLQRILSSKDPFHKMFFYPVANIQRASPYVPGAFTLFNKLYLPQCNSFCLQFQLGDEVFSPSPLGVLFPIPFAECDMGPSVGACEWEHIETSDLHISGMAMVHSMMETRNGFYHVGISLLPACPVSVPIWLSDEGVHRWLLHWKTHTLKEALEKSLVAVSLSSGDIRMQSLSDNEKQAAKMSKWLYGQKK
jgi:hypothetical protein